MLKKISIKQISRYTMLLFVVFLIYLFPEKENYTLKTVNKEINYHDIFLMDENGYISSFKQHSHSNTCDRKTASYFLFVVFK